MAPFSRNGSFRALRCATSSHTHAMEWNVRIYCTNKEHRAVSAALHNLQLGGHAVTGAQNSVPSPLRPQRKLRIPKLKYETLEVNEVGGPFERKLLIHYS